MFLRKAGSIGKRDAVAGWLYRVASRIALKAKARVAPAALTQELALLQEKLERALPAMGERP